MVAEFRFGPSRNDGHDKITVGFSDGVRQAAHIFSGCLFRSNTRHALPDRVFTGAPLNLRYALRRRAGSSQQLGRAVALADATHRRFAAPATPRRRYTHAQDYLARG